MRVAGALLFLLFVQSGAKPELEIVSKLGPKRQVKLYSGEGLTFRVRAKRENVGALFSEEEWLHGVTLRLRRWPKVDQDAAAIVKGSNRPIVTELKPGPGLWGEPPSSIRIEDLSPGRYRLEAEKPGFGPDTILIHIASLELVDIDATLTDLAYNASFRVRLDDPEEPRRAIPMRVETLSEAGQVVDMREDVVLAPVVGRETEFRSSRTIRISSTEIEGFRERLARGARDPLPPEFYDLKSLRIVEGGSIRVSFRTMHAVYSVPLGY